MKDWENELKKIFGKGAILTYDKEAEIENFIKQLLVEQRTEFVKEIKDLTDQYMTIIASYLDAKNYNLLELYYDIKVFRDKLMTKLKQK